MIGKSKKTRVMRMSNLKCQMLNEIQMSNAQFYHWDFELELTFDILILVLNC